MNTRIPLLDVSRSFLGGGSTQSVVDSSLLQMVLSQQLDWLICFEPFRHQENVP